MGAYTEDFFNLSEDESYPERVPAARVTPGLFQMLRAVPVLGRTFLPEEGQPGGEAVAQKGHGLWQRRFGSDPASSAEPSK
jgi:putative ABC transport system permease protein